MKNYRLYSYFIVGLAYTLATAAGFVTMILLFYFISIPMMEKRLAGHKNDYDQYKKRVPVLIPGIIRRS